MSNSEVQAQEMPLDRDKFVNTTELGNVQLSWREFRPSNQEGLDLHKAILYIPGWPMDAQVDAVVDLPIAFAENGKARTFALTTLSEEATGDSTARMMTIVKFLHEQGITELIGTAHSLGNLDLADLAVYLKTLRGTPDEIVLKGLVMMNAAGMFDQHGLVPKYAGDFVSTYATELKNSTPAQRHALNDLISSLKGNIDFAGRNYLGIFKEQIDGMTHINPSLAEVDVPVVVVQGENDRLFSYKRVAPIEKLKTSNYSPLNLEKASPRQTQKLLSKLETLSTEQKEERLAKIHEDRENTVINTGRREKYLMENVFKKSPAVRMLVPKKHTVHAGLPLFRPDQTARVSLHLLDEISGDPNYMRSQRDLNPQPHP